MPGRRLTAKSSFHIAIAFLIALSGCRSSRPSIIAARNAFVVGNFASAESTLKQLAEDSRKSLQESQLDLAIVQLASGQPDAAESSLRSLRDHFETQADDTGVRDAAALAASLASDDTTRPFQIAGYERVLVRSLLAMCSLAGDGTDAQAYCLQAQSLQTKLAPTEDVPQIGESHMGRLALVPYLRGTLREATHQDYDDAERSFRLVSAIRPDFLPAQQDIERASLGAHSRDGHGVLYLFAFVGRGPQRVETVAPTTSASLQIASTLLRSASKEQQDRGDEPVLPNIASVKVPTIQIPPSPVAAVGVSVAGQFYGATQTLTDIGSLAVEQSEQEMPWTIGRAVARRVLKESSVAATSDAMGLSGNAAAAFEFAAINAWSAAEKADTRCWGLLPREIQVLRAELPAGHQEITMFPIAADGNAFSQPVTYPIQIEDGRNHYAIIMAPETIISVVPRNATLTQATSLRP